MADKADTEKASVKFETSEDGNSITFSSENYKEFMTGSPECVARLAIQLMAECCENVEDEDEKNALWIGACIELENILQQFKK